jgi:hypothetical protein
VHALFHETCEFREIQVAWDKVGSRVPDPDEGFVDLVLWQTGCMKQGARRRPLQALFHSIASHLILILREVRKELKH